jgi:hypothetical protein
MDSYGNDDRHITFVVLELDARAYFFDYRLGIILKIGFIWLLWFLVENYKEIAKELKLKLDSLD